MFGLLHRSAQISTSFHECLGYYIYLLLFPIIFTLLLLREIKLKMIKSKIPGATEISPSSSVAV